MSQQFYTIFFICLLLLGCAKPVSPTGGPKDEAAPLYVKFSEDSPATSFSDDKIVIAFNEFITLQNVSDVNISPRMEEAPEIKVKGKKVIIKLPEKVDSNYTYNIDLGNAIKDYTEGNKIEELNYVFSLSENIDSANVMGTYINGVDGKAIEEECIICLYPLNETYTDSLIYTKPALFYTVSKGASFSINHLAEGAYQLIILKDENKNQYFDLGEELLGFANDTVFVGKNDSVITEKISLFNLFEERLRIEDSEIVSRETMKIKLNKGTRSLELKPEKEEDFSFFSYNYALNTDSLILYYSTQMDSVKLFLFSEQQLMDSVLLVNDTSLFEQNILPEFLETEKQTVEEGKELTLAFNLPVKQLDYTNWVLTQKVDSIENSIAIDTAYYKDNSVLVTADWEIKGNYKLTIMPESISAFNNTAVFDTIGVNITCIEALGFGDAIINIGIDSLLVPQSFIEIESAKGAADYYSKQNVHADSLVISGLKEGKYNVKLIVDFNGNNKWDTGDFFARKQAELIYTYPDLEIKADWETEITIK